MATGGGVPGRVPQRSVRAAAPRERHAVHPQLALQMQNVAPADVTDHALHGLFLGVTQRSPSPP